MLVLVVVVVLVVDDVVVPPPPALEDVLELVVAPPPAPVAPVAAPLPSEPKMLSAVSPIEQPRAKTGARTAKRTSARRITITSWREEGCPHV